MDPNKIKELTIHPTPFGRRGFRLGQLYFAATYFVTGYRFLIVVCI